MVFISFRYRYVTNNAGKIYQATEGNWNEFPICYGAVTMTEVIRNTQVFTLKLFL